MFTKTEAVAIIDAYNRLREWVLERVKQEEAERQKKVRAAEAAVARDRAEQREE